MPILAFCVIYDIRIFFDNFFGISMSNVVIGTFDLRTVLREFLKRNTIYRARICKTDENAVMFFYKPAG